MLPEERQNTRVIDRRDDDVQVRVVDEVESAWGPLFLVVVAIVGLFLLAGCQSYTASFAHAYQAGQFEAASAQLHSEAGKALTDPSNRDRLLYLLEEGAIQRTRGDLKSSNAALDAADEYVRKLDSKADIRIGRTATAAVTNLGELSYQGYGYDRIMMNTYKALNYMEQGDLQFARAELKRVQYAQADLESRKAGRIEDLQKQNAENQRYSSQAASDPQLAAQTRSLYADVPDASFKASYVNAFAEYLQGIFLMHAGDADDREVARVALRNTYGMIANDYVRQDLDYLEGGRHEPVTYIIHETGVAPARDETKIDVPIWLFNIAAHDTGMDYFGVAFPRLVPQIGGIPAIEARTAAGVFRTSTLVDMDGVIAREFKDEMPTIIARTLVAASAKAALAYAANRATRNDDVLNLLVRVATTAYQYNVNRADLRTWRTLPKWIAIARFPTPADGWVQLYSSSGAPIVNVKLQPDVVNVIWVRTPGDAGGVACRAFPLRATVIAREIQ